MTCSGVIARPTAAAHLLYAAPGATVRNLALRETAQRRYHYQYAQARLDVHQRLRTEAAFAMSPQLQLPNGPHRYESSASGACLGTVGA